MIKEQVLEFLKSEIKKYEHIVHRDDYDNGALDEVRRIERIIKELLKGEE